ncbi:MAG: hypothetical protein Q9178_006049 [Gyalolechia marmorata]
MDFSPLADADEAEEDLSGHDVLIGGMLITPEILGSVVVPLQCGQIGMSPTEKFNVVSAACARYMDWAVKEIQDGGLAVCKDHRALWWKVLQQFRSPDTKDKLDQLTSKLGVEGEAIARIEPEQVRILTGQTNPLFHVLKGELLFRMYLSDEGARPKPCSEGISKGKWLKEG